MSNTTFVDGSTRTDDAWFQAVNDLVYLLFGVTDGVTHTAAMARAALKTGGFLTSVAGTNTVTATAAVAPAAYTAGDSYILIPANTNTGATTLNLNSLGAKNVFVNGAACAGGELVVGVPVLVEYDGTQFNAIGWTQPVLTNSLAADVALNNTGSFFTGPTVAQGTVGKWFASGSVTIYDTSGAASFVVKLWDGTTVIDSAIVTGSAANIAVKVTLSGRISSPAGNIRISVKDASSTSGKIVFNDSGESKDSTLTVIRIG
jgi:hypothetical protein